MSVIYLFASGTQIFTYDSEFSALRALIAAGLVHILAIGLIYSSYDDFIGINYCYIDRIGWIQIE